MRQIVLDTETTGIGEGHKIIEIACVELIGREIGSKYVQRVNPQRLVDPGAYKIHGISDEDLAEEPIFAEICDTFLEFVKGSEIIAHNAAFDVGFLDFELKSIQRETLRVEAGGTVLDTLRMARKKHPGVRNSLDALCKRYKIDNSNREKHGALLDAELLAQVYLAMTSEQITFGLEEKTTTKNMTKRAVIQDRELKIIYATEAECKIDEEYRATHLKRKSSLKK